MDPVLLWRIGHDSLCAHWLILGLIWLHLQSWPEGRDTPPGARPHVGFLYDQRWRPSVSCRDGVGTRAALVCKFHWVDHSLSRRQMALWGGVYGAATLGVFAALGYIGSGISWGANGFGDYSADLLTLINPAGSSRFLPALPVAPGQYEGFGYVGSGVLVLSIIGMAIIWYNPSVLPKPFFETLGAVRDLRGLIGGLCFVLKGDACRETHPHPWPFLSALHRHYCAFSYIWTFYLAPTLSLHYSNTSNMDTIS